MPVNVFLNLAISRKRVYRYAHFSQDFGCEMLTSYQIKVRHSWHIIVYVVQWSSTGGSQPIFKNNFLIIKLRKLINGNHSICFIYWYDSNN